jgi:hypothetical protein
MSHAVGEIWSTEKGFFSKQRILLGWFEYNGTSDIACTRVYNTREEMLANWRGNNSRSCFCKAVGQSVILYTDYGNGYHWPGRVCWNCMSIIDGMLAIDTIEGHPFRPSVNTTDIKSDRERDAASQGR